MGLIEWFLGKAVEFLKDSFSWLAKNLVSWLASNFLIIALTICVLAICIMVKLSSGGD